MNYYMILTGGMNARREPDPTKNNVIETLPAGTRVEGDALVKSPDGRDWLSILLIDGRQVVEPAFIATYTTNGKLETNPPVDPGLAVQVEISFVSASPVSITLNGVPVGQEQYSGTIVISPAG
jgi:hypothetical protein